MLYYSAQRSKEKNAEYYGYQQNKFKTGKLAQKNMIKSRKLSPQREKPKSKDPITSSRKWKAKSETVSQFQITVEVPEAQKYRNEKVSFNVSELKREVFFLRREVDRLDREIFKKDKIIFEMKTKIYENKEAETQLTQAYRAVHYFEGKVLAMQAQIEEFKKLYSEKASSEIKMADLNQIFDNLIKQNEKLSGQLELESYNLELSEGKCKRFETKIFKLKRQISFLNRKLNDPTEKEGKNRIERMVQMFEEEKELDLKEKIYVYQLSEKVKELQDIIEDLKAENEVMQTDLEEKNLQITDLFKTNFKLKKNKTVSTKSVQKSKIANSYIEEDFSKINGKENCQLLKNSFQFNL